MNTIPVGPTGPYKTLEYDPNGEVQTIDLSTVEVLCTAEQAAFVIGLMQAALAKAGRTADYPNLAVFEQGVGKFNYYLIPGDPRGPKGIGSTVVVNGVPVFTEVTDFAAEFVAAIQRFPGGEMLYAPVPNSPDKNFVFQWV